MPCGADCATVAVTAGTDPPIGRSACRAGLPSSFVELTAGADDLTTSEKPKQKKAAPRSAAGARFATAGNDTKRVNAARA